MRDVAVRAWLVWMLVLSAWATACDEDDDGGGEGSDVGRTDVGEDGRGGGSDLGGVDVGEDLTADDASSDAGAGPDMVEPDTTDDDGGGVDASEDVGEDATSGGDMGMGTDLADATGSDGGSGGACDNPGDFAALGAPGLDTEAEIGACALRCALTGPECSVPCVEEGLGVSNGCAVCFGDVISCTVANCALQCLDSASAGCRTCQETSCFPAFTECAGISLPE